MSSIPAPGIAPIREPLHRHVIRQPVLFKTAYSWLVIVSTLDIVFTWLILHRGGYEANALAAGIIERYGLVGMVVFKFSMMAFVISLSEFIGRRKLASARLLAYSAALLSTFPVVVGLVLLASVIH